MKINIRDRERIDAAFKTGKAARGISKFGYYLAFGGPDPHSPFFARCACRDGYGYGYGNGYHINLLAFTVTVGKWLATDA